MVGGIDINDPSELTHVYNNYIENKGEIKDMAKATEGKFILKWQDFDQLRQYTNFTELRRFCFKPSHGRTLDMALTLNDKFYSFIKEVVIANMNSCDIGYRYIGNDNSLLKTEHCNSIISHHDSHWAGIEGAYLYKWGRSHTNLRHWKTECDDFSGQAQAGKWAYYFR